MITMNPDVPDFERAAPQPGVAHHGQKRNA